MTRHYTDQDPIFPDRADWALPTILRTHAAARPDATYLDAPEEALTWTYAEALASAERVARAFLDAGAVPGDRVLIMAANSSRFVRTWLGTALGGLVEVPLNTAYEHEFLAHQVDTVQARWAVIEDRYAERMAAIAPRCSVERFWVIDTGRLDEALAALRAQGWEAGVWDALEDGGDAELPVVGPRDLASIFFTSGTTGPSKGVAMPHSHMYFFADETVALTQLTAADTYFTATPLFHGNAQFMAAYPALVVGGRVVVRSRFSASGWIGQIRESGATVTNLVGAMMDFVYKQPPKPDDADNRLRCIFAAPTAFSIADDFKARFGLETFVELFGLTETSAPIIAPYGAPRPPGAAGLLNARWFDVRLVDPDTDEEVPVGAVGELTVRPLTPWTCSLGYYNMPEKTVEAWRNLWFHTGDALRRDEEGWYYFVDRFKDALRRRGENISSYEVEQGLLSSPDVLECAVIGVPAGFDGGEDEVMAVVVPATPARDPAALWAHCEQRLPKFAVPRFIRFVDALPKTPSEKVRKAALRDDGITADAFDRDAQVPVQAGARFSENASAPSRASSDARTGA